MGARRTGRERALQALYQLEMAEGTSSSEALASAWACVTKAQCWPGGSSAGVPTCARAVVAASSDAPEIQSAR